MIGTRFFLVAVMLSLLISYPAFTQNNMSFFITSVGSGDGANLGGLEGADLHCQMLAEAAGAGDSTWRAYLSTTGPDGVNARDRIGSGPWHNAKGALVAGSLEYLHTTNYLTKETQLTEQGTMVNGRGDTPNQHDILTGTRDNGMATKGSVDTTCGNWTSNADGEGSALVGHHDREGGGPNPSSWNSSHPSRGCSQENLIGSGGNGYFYCFASN